MVSCYSDKKKCKKAERIINSRARASELKLLADSGNVEACVEYGLLLMKGIWDEYEMGIDLVHGQLSPATEDDTANDKYLIKARDPIEAVEYFKMAASYGLETCCAKKTAESVLEHCKKFGLAGFRPPPVDEPPGTDKEEEVISLSKYHLNILNYCGKSAVPSDGDVESSQFVPLPDVRPEAKNPLTTVFHLSGNLNSEMCLKMIMYTLVGGLFLDIFFLLVFLLLSKSFNYLQMFNLFVVLVVLFATPQLIFSLLFIAFGQQGNLPICDCKEIREAYEESIKGLPEDLIKSKDPFNTTNIFIRKLKHFRQWFFWSYIAASLIQIILLFAHVPFREWMIKKMDFVLTWISLVLIALLSGFVLIFEKDFDHGDDDDDGYFGLFMTSIFFWAYKDTACLQILRDFKDDDDDDESK